MENASQALLIAGGILLAIIVLSMLIMMINNVSETQKNVQTAEEAERLENWNAEWLAYDKKLLYGTEVLTVINKAKDSNSEYEDEDSIYCIKVIVKEGDTVQDEQFVKERKTNIFECTQMTKNTETGRVNYIEFKLKK